MLLCLGRSVPDRPRPPPRMSSACSSGSWSGSASAGLSSCSSSGAPTVAGNRDLCVQSWNVGCQPSDLGSQGSGLRTNQCSRSRLYRASWDRESHVAGRNLGSRTPTCVWPPLPGPALDLDSPVARVLRWLALVHAAARDLARHRLRSCAAADPVRRWLHAMGQPRDALSLSRADNHSTVPHYLNILVPRLLY